jgi:hypothetical protein
MTNVLTKNAAKTTAPIKNSFIKENEMLETIERLKQEKEADFASGQKAGIEHGQRWAKKDASLASLRYVCEGDGLETNDLLDQIDDYGDRGWLADLAMDGGADIPTFQAGYAKGFTEGAKSIWNAVKGKL